jgi:hypothetical protein
MTDKSSAGRAAAARTASPFLNTRQAAFYLVVSVGMLEQFRRARSTGRGPRVRRHGGRVFYHIDDLDRWSETGQ